MPVISSGGAVAFMIAMSSVIGFPLPFALVVGIPVWFVVLVVCFVAFFGRILKRDPVLLRELIRSIVVLICQVLLTFVYPAYLYGFISIEPAFQKFYVMLLPIIKIIAKNWISYCLGNKFDLLPQIMIFNMVALDALLAWVSLSDIQHFMKTIYLLRRKIPAGHPLKNASFIEIAIQITDEDPQARDRLAHRRYNLAQAVRLLSTSTTIVGGPLATTANEQPSTSRQVLPADPPNSQVAATKKLARNPALELIPTQKSLATIFTAKE
ncbi:hypothetical protein GN958_ATG03876 [Phytophthora infestans]|uniref:Transmembrane protein n=1 Tax=Phytophthora infestans TaxID=4787 RepID=A0A8S9UYL3_PHYIN|nr:hypothetical protein GN958_ATG04590 [Phytophthora infestans]KAF4146989.1 hypothetical protein GN958_ATG03876 [Phytophthora infestans]